MCRICSREAELLRRKAAGLDESILTCPEIWGEVAAERERAHRKHGRTSMEALRCDDPVRLTVLVEEVGEVARAFNEARHRGGFDSSDFAGMREELVQVAAMAGAWAAALTPYATPRGNAASVKGENDA
jgi:hypothetical protein